MEFLLSWMSRVLVPVPCGSWTGSLGSDLPVRP